MDSVFQSLLLGPTSSNDVNNGGVVNKDKSSSTAASSSSSSSSAAGPTTTGIDVRPSRYATLIPREAVKKMKHSHDIRQEDDDEEERVAVYKLVNGELTLLAADEYDVVSVTNESQINPNIAAAEDEAMDIDSSTEANDTEEDDTTTTLYIVRPNTRRGRGRGGRVTFSSATVSPLQAAPLPDDDNNIMNMEEDNEDEEDMAAIKEASHTASTLARALAQRTDGFDQLRPKYYDFLNPDDGNNSNVNNNNTTNNNNNNDDDTVVKTTNTENDDKKKANKLSTTTTITSPSSSTSLIQSPFTKSGGDKSNNVDGGKMSNNVTAKNTSTTSTTLQQRQQQQQLYIQTQKLIASLNHHHTLSSSSSSSSCNIRDGDTPKTLLQLTQMRMWQERHIDPSMQGMELDNWEDGIDWEGGCDDNDDDTNKNDDNDSTNNEEKKEENEAVVVADNDYYYHSYKPPIPEGGYPKRPRRMMKMMISSLPQYDDPVELLYEPRNPRLDALDLITSVDWEGATSDTSDDDDDDGGVNVPLILQSSIAGKSVASLLAPCPTSRPLPFELHPSYQQRYDREMTSEITSTADIGNKRHEALEKYKEQRQRKREQMAKDKQSRVTEVMSALSLSGTGRRITSSLMGPGGAER
jgi:hypothetical protein